MPKVKPQIIIIQGPTSSGKSDVAIKLAKEFNGEIISADSRQVFRGMNLGTGKVEGIWDEKLGVFVSEGVPHHLIDVADPGDDFNVSHFKDSATKIIKDIWNRKKVPIICGGTNFWIGALLGTSQIPEVSPNEELRAELGKIAAPELFLQLQKLDPERAAGIDPHNKVRLIRAIEICKTLGKVPKQKELGKSHYDAIQIALEVPREELNKKIKLRLEQRFQQGMIQEVENLKKQGVSWEWLEGIGLEYRWIARFLQGKISESEMHEKLYFDSIHYAKRQMTWLKKDSSIIWCQDYDCIQNKAKEFLK